MIRPASVPLALACVLLPHVAGLAAAAPAAEPGRATRRTPVVAAVEKAGPAVVNISTEQIITRRSDPFFAFRNPFFDDSFREYYGRFGGPRRRTATSLGSGVIIDPDGYVVTNEHVVHKASRIHLTLGDGTRLEGKLLSADADSDLALIKVESPTPLPTLPMGRSDDLMIGETVVALGNPFGLESTVTTGVVSAKNRSVNLRGQEAYAGLIQTDAAINPGNSGGALVNIHGQLIGINVAIYAQAQGIGFAIPVDRVRTVVTSLFNYRVAKKTYIGIKTKDITAADVRRYRLAATDGALICGVDPRSPAATAGLRPGDVVRQVDGRAVTSQLTFFKCMLRKDVGQTCTLRTERQGTERAVTVTLAAVPKPSGIVLARRKLGLTLQPMTAELARSFGLRRPAGLLVTDVEPDGPGHRAGLQRSDIVLRFGPLAINTLTRLAIVLEQVDQARVAVLLLRRNRLYRATLTTR